MQKLKRNANLVVIIAILFVTGLSFASAFRSQNNPFVSVVSADDDEEDREEDEDDREDDSDSDRDEDEDDREDEDENDDEDEQRTIVRTRTSTQVRAQEVDDDEDENEADEDENEDAEELKEDISEFTEDIQKVESRINILASSGVAVDVFRNSLNEVKGLLVQAQSNSQEAESVLEIAEQKLERLEKLVKMSLKDDDEDEESTEEAIEEISELRRDVVKIESRLSLASTRGLDVSSYKMVLEDAKLMLVQAELKLKAGLYIEAEALAELANKKLDRIDDVFEDDDEDEDEIADEYKNEVALFVHNLKEIGEIEGGIGQQVSVVAQAQNDSVAKVESSIDEINDRSGLVKFLVGPKYGNIAEIQTAITENQTRIKVLTDLVTQIADPVVKQVLQDQIRNFQQENARLQTFITESDSGISLFGWLVKMFS